MPSDVLRVALHIYAEPNTTRGAAKKLSWLAALATAVFLAVKLP